MNRYWASTNAYKRILEILEDYWITEPDEASVVVDIQLLHRNGEYQTKHIVWDNPTINWPGEGDFRPVSAVEILDKMLNGEYSNTVDEHISRRADQLKRWFK